MSSSEIFTQHVKGLCDLMGRLMDLLDQSVSQDPVIWENPLDVIQIIRSCYYSSLRIFWDPHEQQPLYITFAGIQAFIYSSVWTYTTTSL